jgi:uncharacterized protein (DUF1684 family)
MPFPILILLLVSVTALVLSIGALLVAFHSLRRYHLSSAFKLSVRLTETESMIEALSGQLRNVRAARNMQAHRERQTQASSSSPSAAPPLTETDDADAQRREMNLLVATKMQNGGG